MSLQWINRQSKNFNAPSNPAPLSETFDLVNSQGTVLLSITDDGNGTVLLNVKGGLDVDGDSNVDGASAVAGDLTVTGNPGIHVAHAKYSFAVDGGAQATITPADSDTIPDKAIIVGATINSPTAVTSEGSATVAIGTSAGSATDSIIDATAIDSYSADALLNGVPVFDTPVKLTDAGQITFTIGTADLTAGIIEVWVYYVVAAS